MQPLTLHTFPRAILHIDGDAFFASCEQSRRPKLQGRPVVTGKERGIVASMSYEAKARGVTRGMRLAEIRKRCPDAVILPSDYETYSLLSKRLFTIVRRYTPDVEEYSIDECFCDVTGLRRPLRMSYRQIAERIKYDLDTELGFTFSLGLAPPKELPREVRPFWRRVRSVLKRVRSVLEGVAAVGEPLWTGGVGWRGVLGTDLPLNPCDLLRAGHGRRSGRTGATVAALGRGLIPAPRGAPVYIPTPWPAWPSS